ncbi:hypothetical protein [Aureispira anguillae]|uniref:Uncharacterized protein n=1 Tax=Aureispira anguillae TaxID=2864201 RepID=A0A915YCM9_9BACT|nr:hypothetical protein [Aureispira anguillae]BDS10637.1 hypothetical protein AsAng_0013460 [Aureispira anguillae]
MTEYNLNFMHPQYGTTFNVDIDGSFTVEEMINNLLLSGFINENKHGYDFELMGQALDRQITFDEIQALNDGAVIRIIAHQEEAIVEETDASDSFISLHIKHPSEALVLDVELSSTLPLSNIIQQASDKNFIQGKDNILHLQKGDKLLDLNQTALENKLSAGDYLQIIHANLVAENPIETAFGQLNEKIQQLETQIETELGNIKDALPAANMIPIDTTRAINPTMEQYESIDTIVNRLRKNSNQPPLKRIRPVSPVLLLSLGFLLVLILIIALVMNGII